MEWVRSIRRVPYAVPRAEPCRAADRLLSVGAAGRQHSASCLMDCRCGRGRYPVEGEMALGVRPGAAWHWAVRPDTAWHWAVRPGTAWHWAVRSDKRHGTGPSGLVRLGTGPSGTACRENDAGSTPGRPPTAAVRLDGPPTAISGLPSGLDGLAVGPAALRARASGHPRRSGRLASPACVEPLFVCLFVCLFACRGGLGRGGVRYADRPDRCAGWL
jgi:hypothetical protein